MATPELPVHYSALLAARCSEVAEKLSAIFLDTAQLFVWEIGSGHGHFLTAYASAHPGQLCVGVDIESDRVARATRKRDRMKLSNLHFIRSEARLFLQALPAEARITDIFILFPDPWPKARHHKHRLLQPDFLARLARHASHAARLYFRTDHREYFDQAMNAIRGSPDWELIAAPWPFEYETVFQSRAQQHHSLIARKRTGQA